MRTALVFVFALVAAGASADITYVNPGESIQTAIHAASAGDTILLNDGVYNEAGISMKPGVKLRSTSGDTSACIIDAGNPPLFFSIFTMEDCGGIACYDGSAPILDHCSFKTNSAASGANIDCNGSSPILSDCDIHGGSAYNNGDGLFLANGSSPTLTNVSFGTMQCNIPGAHGQCVYMETGSSPSFTNVSFYNSGIGYGELLYTADGTCSPTFSCCNIYVHGANSSKVGGSMSDPTGSDGNISEDPLYCDAINWDLSVDAASPNLPGSAQNDCGTLIGCFGQGCDSPVEETSWGAIKAMYR